MLVNLVCVSFPPTRLSKKTVSLIAVRLVQMVILKAKGAVIKVVAAVKDSITPFAHYKDGVAFSTLKLSFRPQSLKN